ncbi:MAG: hypothetical protein HY562_06780 [Ignavibacteriales bacterium]|nr:hypothetical protein [Ignavibacteriales bacterium]
MFERFEHISPKTKILFAVILLILLPSAFLSYFGLESIDQKAENLRANYRASVNLIRDKLEHEIVRLQENLPKSFVNLPSQAEDAKKIRTWLHAVEEGNSSVKNPFVLNSDRGIISTQLSIDWKPDQRSVRYQVVNLFSFQKAEESEYIQKVLNEAISFYRAALAEAAGVDDRSLVLSRIGRCYHKLGKYKDGIQAFQEILRSPGARIGSLPASVVALHEISDGYAAMGNLKQRAETNLKLYRLLLDFPWSLDDGSYVYYLRSVSDAVRDYRETSASDLGELNKQEEYIQNQARLLYLLKQEAIDAIEAELKNSTAGEVQPIHISVVDASTRHQLGFFKLPLSHQRVGLRAIGFEVDKHTVLKNVVPLVLQSIDLGLEVAVGITNELDSTLFIQGNLPPSRYLVAGDLGHSMVGWKVALFDRAGRSLDEQLAAEKRLHMALIGGVILVMALGIVVTVRAAVHEMEAARIKSDFVANVSHELKTPLSLIRMFGETLETGIVTNEDKRREFYGIIRRESERLTHLINNVLDFSKIDAGTKQYIFQRTDLVEVIKSTLQAYTLHIRDLGFELESQFPNHEIWAWVDKDAIEQALLNLLSNATKYSDERKRIRIEVTQNSSVARILVSDEGVGIPERELKKVFDKFYRGSTAATKETRGAGLGLTVVKHIVEAHKGIIQVESVEGKGSSFILEIPLLIKS